VSVGASKESYEIATGLTDGEHDVVITKKTEPVFGTAQLVGLVPTGGALVPTPVPAAPHRIEMIGDSITAGYGILGANENCNFSPETESEPSAWGALAAKEVAADRSVVAWSGIGVWRDSAGGTVDQMPTRYDRAIASDPASTWTHASFEPDAIVVNLGTNDFAQGDPGAAFETAYIAFLQKLRTTHPQAYLVVATSPMLTDSYPEGEQRRTKSLAALNRIVEARKTGGDAKVALLTIDEQTDADKYGCDYHPSTITAQKMGARLAGFLKSTLGW
jgi:lysophospholipase L1-like esterase